MHGFALNVDHRHDVHARATSSPCGIADRPVTSLAEEGIDVTMREVVDVVARLRRASGGASGAVERQDVAWRHRPDDLSPFSRGDGPGAPVASCRSIGPTLRRRGRLDRGRASPTAWRSRRASPSGCGRRCTSAPRCCALKQHRARARPGHGVRGGRLPEPLRVLGRRHGHVHGARRALHPGVRVLPRRHPPPAGRRRRRAGAGRRGGRADGPRPRRAHDGRPRRPAPTAAWRTSPRCVEAIRGAPPGTHGRDADLRLQGRRRRRSALLFAARPDVLNHNIETVARLQRAVRPSAGYARSLSRAGPGQGRRARRPSRGSSSAWARPTTRSSVPSPTWPAIGVDIVTIGQYLRPTTHHLPVARWVEPGRVRTAGSSVGEALGIGHVEASPLTRSSYHAKAAAASRVAGAGAGAGGDQRPLTTCTARSTRPVTTQLDTKPTTATAVTNRPTESSPAISHGDCQQHGSEAQHECEPYRRYVHLPPDVHCQCLFPRCARLRMIFRTDSEYLVS